MDWYRRRPLFWWALALILGILFATVITEQITLVMSIGSAVVALIGLKNFSSLGGLYVALVILLLLLNGIFLATLHQVREHPILSDLAESDVKVHLTGTVMSVDSTRTGNYRSAVDLVALHDTKIKAQPFEVWLPRGSGAPEIGDTLQMLATIERYPLPRNPGQFNYRNYQQKRGRFFQGMIEYPWHLEIIPGFDTDLRESVLDIQDYIVQMFRSTMSQESADFASALILGKRDLLDETLVDTYSSMGVVHVMAVSGLHVGFVVLILLITARVFRLPFRYQVAFTMLGLFLYAALVDFRPSVVRASVMASVLLIAQVSEKRYDMLNLLGFAAIIILVFDPMQIYQLGFQLSFIAVLSIVTFYEKIEKWLNDHGLQISNLPTIGQYIAGLLIVSGAAFVGTAPITTYHFGILPLWGIIINLLVIPLIGVIVIGAFTVLISSVISMGLAGLYAEFPDLLIRLLNWILPTLHTHGVSAISLPHFHWLLVMIFYGVLVLSLLWRYQIARKISLFGTLIGLNILLLSYSGDTQSLRVTFFDVGQGDAALVEIPGHYTMLIDAGIRTTHGDRGKEVILPYLEYAGIRDIDVAVLSHPHNDHVGGFPAVLKKIRVQEIWDTRHSYSTQVMDEIRTLADSQKTKYRIVSAGFDTIIGTTKIHTFFPVSKHLNDNINDHSLVQRFSYGNTSVLFTGDIETDIDPFLVKYDSLLDADILKVPHHGSITSSSVDLLRSVSPEYAVVSVGYKNKFDHPSEHVLKRYSSFGIQTVLTRDVGAVIFESDGKNWRQIHWRHTRF